MLALPRFFIPSLMQSSDLKGLHKTELERPTPPLIIGSTNMDNQDIFPPTSEPTTKEKLSPQPADSIVMQTDRVEASEQASLGKQVRYDKTIARTSLAHKDRPKIKMSKDPQLSRTANQRANSKRYLMSTQTMILPCKIWPRTMTTMVMAMVSVIMWSPNLVTRNIPLTFLCASG